MNMNRFLAISAGWVTAVLLMLGMASSPAKEPVRVFVMAGDENMLRQGSIDGGSREAGKAKEDPAEATTKPGCLFRVMPAKPWAKPWTS